MPFPRLIRILPLLLAAWLLSAQDSVVVVLRHGEKNPKGAFAELNAAGLRRAEALVPELAAFHPVALYVSDYKRTRQTLEPLARRLGLALQIRPRGEERALAEDILQAHAGQAVVVCSHSDRIGALVEALGHPWDAGEVRGFDRLWVLRKAAGGPATLEERRQEARP